MPNLRMETMVVLPSLVGVDFMSGIEIVQCMHKLMKSVHERDK